MKKMLLAVLLTFSTHVVADSSTTPEPLIGLNQTGGIVKLTFEPCQITYADAFLASIDLTPDTAKMTLQKAVSNGYEGEHEACWFSIEPPASQPGITYVPKVHILLKTGIVVSRDLLDFKPQD